MKRFSGCGVTPARRGAHSGTAGRVFVTVTLALLSPALVLADLAPSAAQPVGTGVDVTYSTDEDFDKGVLVNVTHTAPNSHQLQLNQSSGAFPFIWVALSQRCTIAKINTRSGVILGEYRTVSDDAPCHESSRTTVALDGSVWVGHRGPGGVTHVGLSELSECVDRNGNGAIDTSAGYGDVRPWAGAESVVGDAQDECIIHHVDTAAAGLPGDSRHLSIDPNNKLWVGDWTGGQGFIRIDGSTGTVETPPRSFGCGGYGGLIDRNGVIWSSNRPHALLRWDPNSPDSATNPRCIPVPVYGLAIDRNGSVWVSEGPEVRKVSPDGTTIDGPFLHGSPSSQGLAVDGKGDVWVSSSLFCGEDCTVGHLKNDGTFVGNMPNPTGSGSTGVSVDADGKVWTANLVSNTATRIDPAAGPLGCDGTGCGSNTRVGAADLTVTFPETEGPPSRPVPHPYNYSDMTGAQLLNATAPQGTWTVLQDGGTPGTEWGKVTWNTEPQGATPPGTSIVVDARAADTQAAMGAEPFVPVSNGTAFRLVGRFLQVRVTMKPDARGTTPVLSDIRIQSASRPVDLSISKTASADAVLIGEPLTYVMQVSNPSASLGATGVVVTDTLPAGVTFISATSSQGSCTHAAGVVTCDLGAIGAGSGATVTIGVRPDTKGAKINTASVRSNEPDVDPANNSAAATSTVVSVEGSAFGEQIRSTTLSSGPLPHVSRSTAGTSQKQALAVHLLGVLSADVLDVSTVIGPGAAVTSTAAVKVVRLAGTLVTAEAIQSTCSASASTRSGSTTLVAAKVAGGPVPANPSPNTTIEVPGVATVVLNEQIVEADSITVNAVRVRLAGLLPWLAIDIVVADSHCRVGQ